MATEKRTRRESKERGTWSLIQLPAVIVKLVVEDVMGVDPCASDDVKLDVTTLPTDDTDPLDSRKKSIHIVTPGL